MVTTVARGLLILTAAVLLLSCGMVVRPAKEFSDASQDFMARLRWKDYNGAAGHLTEEHRSDFLERFSQAGDLNIVDVHLESVDFSGENRAETWTVLEYYLLPSAAVKTFRLRQEWSYEGGDRYRPGVWRIITPFPPFPLPAPK